TSNLLPMLPVYFVTDLAGPYRAPPSPQTREKAFSLGHALFLALCAATLVAYSAQEEFSE
ncbi:MAG: hypothetical protein ACLQAT_12220, partial [Candidatus Binataceae bacterium]